MKDETNNMSDEAKAADKATSPDGMEYTYKLIKGSEGYLYVSIQPLMKDIANSVNKMRQMDVSHLSEENQNIFDLKLLGLTTVYEFLGAFITEQIIKDKAAEVKGVTTITTDDGYHSGGLHGK